MRKTDERQTTHPKALRYQSITKDQVVSCFLFVASLSNVKGFTIDRTFLSYKQNTRETQTNYDRTIGITHDL